MALSEDMLTVLNAVRDNININSLELNKSSIIDILERCKSNGYLSYSGSLRQTQNGQIHGRNIQITDKGLETLTQSNKSNSIPLKYQILLEIEGKEFVDLDGYDSNEIHRQKIELLQNGLINGSLYEYEGGLFTVIDCELTQEGKRNLGAFMVKEKYGVSHTIGENIFDNKKHDKLDSHRGSKLDERKMKVFISHSSNDDKIMELFVDLLVNIYEDLSRKEIFCTSVAGCKIKPGHDIYEWIKKTSTSSLYMFGMFSDNLMKSPISLFEIGIGWANGILIPAIIQEGFSFDDMPKPLESKVTQKLFIKDDLNEILDHLSGVCSLNFVDTNTKEKKVDEFLNKLNDLIKDPIRAKKKEVHANHLEESWERDKSIFENNSSLIKNFDLIYSDSIVFTNNNYNLYEDDVKTFLSLGLFENDFHTNLFKITEKGKFYYTRAKALYKKITTQVVEIPPDLRRGFIIKNSFELDYANAIQIIKAYEHFNSKYKRNHYFKSNLVSEIFSFHNHLYESHELFFDRKLNELYESIYINTQKFNNTLFLYVVDKDVNPKGEEIGELNYNICRLEIVSADLSWYEISELLESTLIEIENSYNEFKKEVMKLKNDFDIKHN